MFVLKIETDNAAFRDPDVEADEAPEHMEAARHHVAKLLKDIATDIENGSSKHRIFDGNGNVVGEYELKA